VGIKEEREPRRASRGARLASHISLPLHRRHHRLLEYRTGSRTIEWTTATITARDWPLRLTIISTMDDSKSGAYLDGIGEQHLLQ
jgi:hypothetical protein